MAFAWSNLVPCLKLEHSGYVKDFKRQIVKVSLKESLGKCDKLTSDDDKGHCWV